LSPTGRPLLVALSLALTAALAGCGHGSGARDRYAGWHTVVTPHLAVHSPLAVDDAEKTAFQLELVYQALAVALFQNANLEPVQVIVFGHPEDTGPAVADARKAGREGRERGALVLVLRDHRRAPRAGTGVQGFTTSWQMVAARDLGRRFLDGALDHPPPWLREGLTRYVSTAQVEGDTAVFGRRPDDLAAELGKGRAIPLGQVLDAGDAELRGPWGRDYQASAWGFIHYLLDGEGGTLRRRFDLMMAALVKERASSRAAVARAFPDIPFAVLEGKVRDYMVDVLGRRPSFHPYPVSVTPPPPTRGTAAPAAAPQIHALLLGLR
jgi:hypothetical protein